MWGPENGPRPTPNPANDAAFARFHLSATREFPVAPDVVWALITDPTLIGTFSPECVQGRWIEGGAEAAVGVRFEGTNRTRLEDGRLYEWVRPCTITTCHPPFRYRYMTHDRWDVPATEWAFDIEPISSGARVTESMRVVPGGLPGLRVDADADPTRAEELLARRLPELETAMRTTLERMCTACVNG